MKYPFLMARCRFERVIGRLVLSICKSEITKRLKCHVEITKSNFLFCG